MAHRHTDPAPAPLAGLRVVEVASFVAAPLAGLSLAQLGADVIRIDPIGGSADRDRWPLSPDGRSLYWAGLNRQKRTIELDLRSPEGRELVVALATQDDPDAGIVVTNAVRGDWISYETLSARRSDLIHARLTGMPDGAPAVDYTVNAGLGFPLVTGADSGPVNHVLPAWDLMAGMNLALGVVVAERNRRITGQGSSFEVSLWDVGLHATSALGYLAEAAVAAEPRRGYGNYFYGGFGRDFATADGRVMVVILSGRQWQKFAEAVGETERLDALGADFTTDDERFGFREQIAEIVEPWFASRTTADALATLVAAGVVAGPYRSFTELAQVPDGLVGANPIVSELEEDGIGCNRVAGSPIVWHGRLRVPTSASHRPGVDTEAVLADVLGLSAGEIGSLSGRGIIG